MYEENKEKPGQQSSSLPAEASAILELHHETALQRQVIYKREPRLLSGFADYIIWYDEPQKSKLATNLIIVEAKKRYLTDSCMGQLAAYMGVVHAGRKEQKKENSIVYGAASDRLSFRFCRIDNNGHWSRLLEWKWGDEESIYSIFRSLIRITALPSFFFLIIKCIQSKDYGTIYN